MSALAGMTAQAVATAPANQTIANQATATYQDAANNQYTALSNIARVVVRQVYSAELGRDQSKDVAPGQEVTFTHTLTNTGNGTDQYTITLSDTASAANQLTDRKVYLDLDGDGTAEAGEPEITGPIELDAGASASLAIVGTAPVTLNATTGVKIAAVSAGGGANSVIDVTDGGGGADTTDGTNDDVATVRAGAVLKVEKELVNYDADARTAQYRVRVTNTTGVIARHVYIFDGAPTAVGATNVNSTVTQTNTTGFTAALDEGPTIFTDINESQVFGGADLNGNGNTTDLTESELGIDLNNDGDKSDSETPGVVAKIDSLGAGGSQEFTFTVTFASALPSGAKVVNQAYIAYDGTDDGGAPAVDRTAQSNRVVFDNAQVFGVDLTDTDEGDTNSDYKSGLDFDGDNDIQLVNTAPAGATVVFDVKITNAGTSSDIFNLAITDAATGDDFPVGTVFRVYGPNGATQLFDSNGDGVIDTGLMNSGDEQRLKVYALLPSNATAATPGAGYQATMTATSANDGGGNPVNDTTTLRLNAITASGIDIANNNSFNPGVNNDSYTHPTLNPVTTLSVARGDTATFNLYIKNDSGSADSVSLEAGGSYDGTGVLGALPAGWSVKFFDISDNPIGTTVSVSAESSVYVKAVITTSANIRESMTDPLPDRDDDGEISDDLALGADWDPSLDANGSGGDADKDDVVNGNGDGDSDYAIFFRATSQTTGISDIKLDAVDIITDEEVTLEPNNSGGVLPGATVSYSHTLRNAGNEFEEITLSVGTGQTGWTATMYFDTNGDGAPDTQVNNLASGTVEVVSPDGTTESRGVTVPNGTSNLVIRLNPGESLIFDNRVSAPAGARSGEVDVREVKATYNNGGGAVTVFDTTNVQDALLELVKTAGEDVDCNGVPDDPLLMSAGGTMAAPNTCVVWQVVARNLSTQPASQVVITDRAPPYTIYESSTLRICLGDPAQDECDSDAAFTVLTDSADTDQGAVSAGLVTVTLQNEIAGNSAVTVRFATRIEP